MSTVIKRSTFEGVLNSSLRDSLQELRRASRKVEEAARSVQDSIIDDALDFAAAVGSMEEATHGYLAALHKQVHASAVLRGWQAAHEEFAPEDTIEEDEASS